MFIDEIVVSQDNVGQDLTFQISTDTAISGVLAKSNLLSDQQLYADDIHLNKLFRDSGGIQPQNTIRGTSANDQLRGRGKRDIILGGEGQDAISAGGKNDILKGGKERDFLKGQSGNDLVFGNQDEDVLWGNGGDDRLRGDQGDDLILSGHGNDITLGGSGQDRLFGNKGNDKLYGDSSQDYLNGGAGRDRLWGGDGNDILYGEDGVDMLSGGAGKDIFVISQQRGRNGLEHVDIILDFTPGKDHLVFSGKLDQKYLKLVQGEGEWRNDTIIWDSRQNTFVAILKNISVEEISKDDVVYVESLPTPRSSEASIPPLQLNEPPSSDPTPSDDTDGSPTSPNGGSTSPDPDNSGPSVPDSDGSEPTSPGGTPSGGTDSGPTTPTTPIGSTPGGTAPVASVVDKVVKFSSGTSQSAIAALGGAKITIGTQTIYIGTQQVSSINQNPIIASFDSSNPSKNWVKTDYEVTGADGRGYGLFWSGSSLYGIFTVDGTQGTVSQDFRRATGDAVQSWLRSYGKGGGPKVSVIGRIDPRTGALLDAAYLSAILSSGNSNSLAVTNVSVNRAGNLVIQAQSYFSPRRPNGQAMSQVGSGSSPFAYTVEIKPDLSEVVRTSAVGWR